MTLSVPRVRHYLKNFEMEKLFIEELGWDHYTGTLDVQVEGQTHTLQGFAEKRGVQIFRCQPNVDGKLPDYNTRRKIEKQVARSAYEHLIIFVDGERTTQIWQWVARQSGQPLAYREHPYYPEHQSGDALIQKLNTITIPLDEEEALDLTGTVHKLRDAFDRDRLTKRFYDHFKREHAAFLSFVKGITEPGDKEWYASLMLNRLMFVYFIQKKGFLDNNPDYLQDRLQKVQACKGKGKFLSFYCSFLLCLFYEGFSKQPEHRELDPDLRELLGNVPYLNGGLFDVHELEEVHPGIDIPDEAFENLFAFFDQYDWHLDTRPLRNGREINPDVLGYIFEKYINQKQMGAYYTKEDITDYISKNTIIPYLFDAAKKKCAVAFEPDSAVWRLLQDDPDRYIYAAVRQGVINEYGEVIPLPREVASGIQDVSKRDGWNRPAAARYALPTETWREHAARRGRCLELREKLQNGEVHQINDLITYNLDIRQFAEDVIVACEGPELLRAFYRAISRATVLDPTCGSGAFLFAALTILEPLYEACFERMQAFVEDLERSGKQHDPRKFSDFRRILAAIGEHPNRTYFILKSIMVNNLYGVDIMEEAVEVCKLRLFLKLVAQVDKVKDLEPLPDIDFNIRSGNTLVGFARIDDVKKTLDGTLGFGKVQVDRIVEKAEIVERAFQRFHEMQIEYGLDASEFAIQKRELRQRLNTLADELDRYLASEYGIDLDNADKYAEWRRSHQPFHWFAEFYGIIHGGGFNVIIGNPPYVETSKVKNEYQLRDLKLVQTGNLFALCIERFVQLANSRCRLGIILPLSAICTPRMGALMQFITEFLSPLYISNFADRPAKLFVRTDMSLSVFLGQKHPESVQLPSSFYTACYTRWHTDFRPYLFPTLAYVSSGILTELSSIPKLGSDLEQRLLTKFMTFPAVTQWETRSGESEALYYHSGGRYFRKCLRTQLSNEYKKLVVKKGTSDAVICLLSSSLYYWLWIALSDCYHVTKRDIQFAPVCISLVEDKSFSQLAEKLIEDLWANADTRVRNRANGQVQKEVNFNVRKSKLLIDQIDAVLAEHFDLSEEESDFIRNFDAKFRLSNGNE
ncbi:hypothetical protein NKDENANG_02532 [Candidatus Entotheonellaceae bacterium PAL068K]